MPALQPQFPFDWFLAFVVRAIEVFKYCLELLSPLIYDFEGTLTADLHALSLVLVFLRRLYNELLDSYRFSERITGFIFAAL